MHDLAPDPLRASRVPVVRTGATRRATFPTLLAAVALTATVASGVGLRAQESPSGPSGLPAVLDADFERRAALSALPGWLRDGAAVYLLGEDGYTLDREGSNGFSCLVDRDDRPGGPTAPAHGQVFAPQCFDEVATRSVMARILTRSRLHRADAMSSEAVARALAEREDEWTPDGTGIVYMASAANVVPDPADPGGPFVTYPPHVMFTAPHVSDGEVSGGVAARPGGFVSGWPFLPGPARAHGLTIVPLDRRLQAAIRDEQRSLLRELAGYVPIEPVEMSTDPFDLPPDPGAGETERR